MAAESKLAIYAAIDPAVLRVINPLTMHFGPNTMLLTMDIEFDGKLSAAKVKEAVDRLERSIKNQYPAIKYIYIEAGSVAAGGREVVDKDS